MRASPDRQAGTAPLLSRRADGRRLRPDALYLLSRRHDLSTARYVYEDIAKGFYGDWQSPVMTVLWSLIDPIAPGPASMFC